MTAGSGPHWGSVPAFAVFPGAGVGVVLIGAEERAGGPGMLIPFLSPSSRVCGGLGEAGPAAPLGAISSLGLSPLRSEGGGSSPEHSVAGNQPLSGIRSQYPWLSFWFFRHGAISSCSARRHDAA